MRRVTLMLLLIAFMAGVSCKEHIPESKDFSIETVELYKNHNTLVDSVALKKAFEFNSKIDLIDENNPKQLKDALKFTDSTLYYLSISNTIDSDLLLKTIIESGGTYIQLQDEVRSIPYIERVANLALQDKRISPRVLFTYYLYRARAHISYHNEKDIYNDVLKPWGEILDTISNLKSSNTERRDLEDHRFLHKYYSFLVANQSDNGFLLMKTFPGYLESIDNIKPTSDLYDSKTIYYNQIANQYIDYDLNTYKSIYEKIDSLQTTPYDWFTKMQMKISLETKNKEYDSIIATYNLMRNKYAELDNPGVGENHVLGVSSVNFLSALTSKKVDSIQFYEQYNKVKKYIDGLPQTRNMNSLVYLTQRGKYSIFSNDLNSTKSVIESIEELKSQGFPRAEIYFTLLNLEYHLKQKVSKDKIKQLVIEYLNKFKKNYESSNNKDNHNSYGPSNITTIIKIYELLNKYSYNSSDFKNLKLKCLTISREMVTNLAQEGAFQMLKNETLDIIQNGLLDLVSKEFINDKDKLVDIINELEANNTIRLNQKAIINNIQKNEELLSILYSKRQAELAIKDTIWTNKQIDSLYKLKTHLSSRLNSEFETYFSLSNSKFDIKKYQKGLKTNTSVVRFYESQDKILGISVNKDEINALTFDKTFDYKEYILKLKDQVYSRKANLINSNFQSFLNNLIDKPYYLSIAAGTDTSYIPFSFYLPESNITYKSSLIHDEFAKAENKANNQLLCVLPDYNNSPNPELAANLERSNTTYDLPFAKIESSFVTELFRGELLENSFATKKIFLEKYQNYNIHHLAMHAVVDEENDYNAQLLFQGDREEDYLDLEEIYNLNLDADLVTLSACNTAYGKIDPIEGAMSLSRAFQYAGARATVTSLWRVPDRETSVIMKSFYTHLKDGKRKDVALKMAKDDYLNAQVEEKFKHPYYWAGFILTGDPSPIVSPTPWWQYALFILLGLGLLWILYSSLSRKRKKS